MPGGAKRVRELKVPMVETSSTLKFQSHISLAHTWKEILSHHHPSFRSSIIYPLIKPNELNDEWICGNIWQPAFDLISAYATSGMSTLK